MIAMISDLAPAIFEQRANDGSTFHCSDSFIRNWLHQTLHWSERRATRAAQKTPTNWEDLCERAFIRMAYRIKEEDVPSPLYINSDQTQVVYAQGAALTWSKTGSKQVSTVGNDEKRAFTIVVSISCDGTVLPFQTIHQGYTKKSCPAPTSQSYDQCIKANFRFEYSKTQTYWSTQETMRTLVDEIIAPYFEMKKQELGLPPTQKSLWQIDLWSVHRSDEFRTWLKKTHPTIMIDYVPGGCTGLFQPCDVGIQQILKHSLKRSYHANLVEEVAMQLDRDEANIVVDKRIAVLRDRSPSWIWNAFQTINKPEIVKKVSFVAHH